MRLRPIFGLLLISALSTSLHAAPALPPAENAAAGASLSGPAKDAFEALKAGDAKKAVDLAKPLAEKGDPDALYIMAFAYESGKGADASRDKALEFYRKAIAAKQKDAPYRIASILLASDKKEDRAEALSVLEAAAKEDPALAGRVLGEAYIRGLVGEKPDADKAVSWWLAAANAGDVTSTTLLGNFYEGQYGFPEKKDLKKSIAAYQKAAESGDSNAMVSYGSRLLSGDKSVRNEEEGLKWVKKAIEAKQYSGYLVLGDYQENVKKDFKAALAEYERGKDVGQVDCMLRSADFYIDGKGTEKDPVRGGALLTKAAEAGSAVAHFRLAVAKLSGDKPDITGGYVNLVNAANGGIPQAQNELGIFYLSGKLGVADAPAAVAWFSRSAKGGFAQAQTNLGMLFERGTGVDQSFANAGQLYLVAANQGNGGGAFALARLFATGSGTAQDLVKAWAYATLASERGIEDGKKLVAEIAPKLDEKKTAEAKKLLEDIKSGKTQKPADEKDAAGTAPAKK